MLQNSNPCQASLLRPPTSAGKCPKEQPAILVRLARHLAIAQCSHTRQRVRHDKMKDLTAAPQASLCSALSHNDFPVCVAVGIPLPVSGNISGLAKASESSQELPQSPDPSLLTCATAAATRLAVLINLRFKYMPVRTIC